MIVLALLYAYLCGFFVCSFHSSAGRTRWKDPDYGSLLIALLFAALAVIAARAAC